MKRSSFILFAGLALVLRMLHLSTETPTPLGIAPRLGPFVKTVTLVGQIEARQQSYLSSLFSSRLEMIAEEGKQVKAGDIVARLESKNLEEERDERKSELEAAESALQEDSQSQAAESTRLKAEIERATARVAQRQLTLKEIEAGTRPEELEKRRLQRELSQKSVVFARSTLSLKEKLAAKGISSRLDVLQARLELAERERDQRIAEAEYTEAVRGPSKLRRQIARQDLALAQHGLKWARRELELNQASSVVNRQKLRARRDSLQTQLQQRSQQLQRAQLRAPLAGTVVLNKTWTNDGLKQVTVGDTVYEGNPFMSVAKLDDVFIRCELEETLLSRIKIGLPISFHLPSVQGKRFSGRLHSIGILAHAPSNRQNTDGLSQVFDLTFNPDQGNPLFKPGTSVEIALPLQQHKQVLLIPKSTVFHEDNQAFVRLSNGQKRPVILGESNAEDVIVRSGLNVTDRLFEEAKT